MNLNANFDVLYILKSSNIRYNGLNINEINTLLYISKLMSIYDGNKATDWGYEFSTSSLGGPFSSDVANELSELHSKNVVLRIKDCFFYNDNTILDLAHFEPFKNRIRYIDVAVNILILNPLPTLCMAVQNEFNVMNNTSKKKNEVLNVTTADATYKLFEMIRGIYTSKNPQLILPALAWIKVLITE